MRFELIDQVLEKEPNRLVAVKSVTNAEEYLGDHFPSFPVLPGVMMLETLVQAGRRLVAERTGDQTTTEPLVLTQVRNVRYGNMVRPGESLKVEVTIRKEQPGQYDFQGVGTVNDQVAVQGRFSLTAIGEID